MANAVFSLESSFILNCQYPDARSANEKYLALPSWFSRSSIMWKWGCVSLGSRIQLAIANTKSMGSITLSYHHHWTRPRTAGKLYYSRRLHGLKLFCNIRPNCEWHPPHTLPDWLCVPCTDFYGVQLLLHFGVVATRQYLPTLP